MFNTHQFLFMFRVPKDSLESVPMEKDSRHVDRWEILPQFVGNWFIPWMLVKQCHKPSPVITMFIGGMCTPFPVMAFLNIVLTTKQTIYQPRIYIDDHWWWWLGDGLLLLFYPHYPMIAQRFRRFPLNHTGFRLAPRRPCHRPGAAGLGTARLTIGSRSGNYLYKQIGSNRYRLYIYITIDIYSI